MELFVLYLPLFILNYSFYSLPINPGFSVIGENSQLQKIFNISGESNGRIITK